MPFPFSVFLRLFRHLYAQMRIEMCQPTYIRGRFSSCTGLNSIFAVKVTVRRKAGERIRVLQASQFAQVLRVEVPTLLLTRFFAFYKFHEPRSTLPLAVLEVFVCPPPRPEYRFVLAEWLWLV